MMHTAAQVCTCHRITTVTALTKPVTERPTFGGVLQPAAGMQAPIHGMQAMVDATNTAARLVQLVEVPY